MRVQSSRGPSRRLIVTLYKVSMVIFIMLIVAKSLQFAAAEIYDMLRSLDSIERAAKIAVF